MRNAMWLVAAVSLVGCNALESSELEVMVYEGAGDATRFANPVLVAGTSMDLTIQALGGIPVQPGTRQLVEGETYTLSSQVEMSDLTATLDAKTIRNDGQLVPLHLTLAAKAQPGDEGSVVVCAKTQSGRVRACERVLLRVK